MYSVLGKTLPLTAALIVAAVFDAQSEGILQSKMMVEFAHTAPGKQVILSKVVDANTGVVGIASTSDLIRSGEDLVRLEAAERASLRKKSGAMSRGLFMKYLAMGLDEEIEVLVTIKYPAGIVYLDKTRHAQSSLKEESMKLMGSLPVADVMAVLNRFGIQGKERMGPGAARCRLSKAAMMALASAKEVASLHEYHTPKPYQFGTTPLSTYAASSYNHSPTPVPSWVGAGVNVATMDAGLLHDDFLACIGIPSSVWHRFYHGVFFTPTHPALVTRALQYAAPSANLWYLGSGSLLEEDMDWLVANGIQSASRSLSVEAGPSYADLRRIDDMAYRWPYPFFSGASGNGEFAQIADLQNYNGMSVGGATHLNQSTWTMNTVTQTVNPYPEYGTYCIDGGTYPQCVGDREMPYLVAPSCAPAGMGSHDACGSFILLEGCGGTSTAAPTVNGMAAAVIASDARMVSWPEMVRVALLATAENVDGGEWSSHVDGKDGAGAVNGANAVQFAMQHGTAYPGGPAEIHGIAAGSLYGSDFNTGDILFNIRVPPQKPAGKHLRVVLTWDSNPVLQAPDNALSDLDLTVLHNGGWSTSTSWNNNVEIVDIPAANLSENAAYQVRINKFANRIPQGARASYFYFAIGWTWVDDHAP